MYCTIQAPLFWPLCSVELKASMYAAKGSETCVRRYNLFNIFSIIIIMIGNLFKIIIILIIIIFIRSNLFNITSLTVCDALSDRNIVYLAKPRCAPALPSIMTIPRNSTTPQNATREEPDRSVIVVAARMDALAPFDQVGGEGGGQRVRD